MHKYELTIEALHKSIDHSSPVLYEFIRKSHGTHITTLARAIDVYLKEHNRSIRQNQRLELLESFTGFDITVELLENLETMPLTLSKAELLVSIFIESIDTCDVFLNSWRPDPKTSNLLNNDRCFDISEAELSVFVYEHLDRQGDFAEEFDNITLGSSSMHQSSLFELSYIVDELEEESLSYFSMNILPSSKYSTLWKSLKYDDELKSDLFGHSKISLKLKSSVLKLNKCNKLLLLYGPPGSGKTTLCHAISQKVSIQYGKSVLVELQCSKIFSRFFGESSKNMELVFKNLRKSIEMNPDLTYFIIIDEIETIASSRSNLLKQNENNDGIRVVNTLLTQLDLLKPFDNFFILTTSNNQDSLDSAFLDRCDQTFHIDRPNEEAIVQILNQSINELVENDIIKEVSIKTSFVSSPYPVLLQEISKLCYNKQLSGRYVSRLPLMALAKCHGHSKAPSKDIFMEMILSKVESL